MLSVADGSGNAITDKYHVGNQNPFRYRGYYYDTETGFYYLQSRYYDPETGRFINGDGYASTGQRLGENMFAYCGNNPVMYADPGGDLGIIVFAMRTAYALYSLATSYRTADDAAKAFSEEIYSSSKYIRHEYGSTIYSKKVLGITVYNYTTPKSGTPHSIIVSNASPRGTKAVAIAHTHPNSNSFSKLDKKGAHLLKLDAYVVGPNLQLQRYNIIDSSTVNVEKTSPVPLTESQKELLVNQFRISWEKHLEVDCGFDCGNITWPTP